MELKNQLDWNELTPEPNAERVAELRRKEYEKNIVFLRLFSTPDGKQVLDWLTSHTLDTPTWWPAADYNKSVANGFFREGQNCLVREIKDKIQKAKDYQEDRPKGKK